MSKETPSPARFSDRLRAARRRFFVGRIAELELFHQALVAEEPPFSILYVFGPGGVGKTTLLHVYAQIAAEHGQPVFRLDGCDIEPSPQGFLLALAAQTGMEEDPPTLHALAALPRSVLLIDACERLIALDAWLREQFLPCLPAHILVVIAARQPPSSAWSVDPAWRSLVRIISLRNLRPEESRQLLNLMQAPATIQDSILGATYGHPLALVLLADWLALEKATPATIDLGRAPDAVRLLVERFVQDAPSPLHRRALEICAHVRMTTEALLAAVLGAETAHDLFRWLQSLSFIEQGADGLFPHDLVREVLEVDLRWRNPDAYREMHRAVRTYLRKRHHYSHGMAQHRTFVDLVYLHRHQSLMRPFYDWEVLGNASIAPVEPSDHAAILQMVARHEGEESARIAAYWLQKQSQAFEVFHAGSGLPLGFVAHLLLDDVTEEDEQVDPAMRSLWAYIRRYGPLRSGECFLCTRFWMGRETYQGPLIHTPVAATATRRWTTTPGLRWAFPCVADPDFWEGMFAYLSLCRVVEADFTVGGRRYGVFAHDWAAEPPQAWLDTLAERELAESFQPQPPSSAAAPELMVLSQPEFAKAVRQALRDYHRLDALARNPLVRSRVVRDMAGSDPGQEVLQTLLRAASESLLANPKDEKFHRALQLTFFRPAPTQEAAAERLGLPFNTYRYHLSKGVEQVTEWLWRRELYGTGA